MGTVALHCDSISLRVPRCFPNPLTHPPPSHFPLTVSGARPVVGGRAESKASISVMVWEIGARRGSCALHKPQMVTSVA